VWLQAHELRRFTATTLVTQRARAADLEESIGRGYAIDRGRSFAVKNDPKTGGISLTTARRLAPSDWSAASNESS
jgi:hypothetical protein